MKLLIFIAFSFAITFGQEIKVPFGNKIISDGVVSNSEWDDAKLIIPEGGKYIKIKQDSRYIYLAIEGEKSGIASIGILNEDTVLILHSSTALITCRYVKDEDTWRQSMKFGSGKQSQIKKIKSDETQKRENLLHYKWTSNKLPFVIPDKNKKIITELIIDKKLFNPDDCRISIVFYQHLAKTKVIRYPKRLKDGTTNINLIRGENVKSLNFSKNDWLKLIL